MMTNKRVTRSVPEGNPLPVSSASGLRIVMDVDFDVDRPASLVAVQITKRLPADVN